MKNEARNFIGELVDILKSSGWIQGAINHPGAFGGKAKEKGMSTAAYAQSVLSGKSKASSQTKRQAKLALTLMSLRKRKKKKDKNAE